ncbi:glycosyltransferase family 2 protein [Staphylococcus chromogenes]|nr:glycosyltransferase family 2 protein [Staphylococcus chromogenes]
MGKLISVIVPVYNKAPFLERCIESLVHLKKHEFVEAIFVDDCSTDDSLEIIKKYAAEYEMIQYVELSENTGGPAEPRN